jgi:hypothetical protein
MNWRPGEASRGRRYQLSSAKKLTQATEGGDAEWNVNLASKHLRPKESWTIHGLGRRGPDGPAGTESAGFAEFNLEGRQDAPRLADGRPLPPMPQEEM